MGIDWKNLKYKKFSYKFISVYGNDNWQIKFSRKTNYKRLYFGLFKEYFVVKKCKIYLYFIEWPWFIFRLLFGIINLEKNMKSLFKKK